MSTGRKAKIVAFYFPQFHAIPENDAWWGPGFTDWVNVRSSRPQFPGHRQPRVPLDEFYYDLSRKETMAWQVETAKAYGVHGFCHYHYWFEGRRLLGRPTDTFLESKELDLPFCLAWANSSWSRRWRGGMQSRQILIRQTHRPDRNLWDEHFTYLLKAWKDPRAITVDGKPIFLIYMPHRIERVEELLDFWRGRAVESGLPGVYFIAMQLYRYFDSRFLRHFDARVLYQPSYAMLVPGNGGLLGSMNVLSRARSLPAGVLEPLRLIAETVRPSLRFYDYDELWEKIMEPRVDPAPVVTYPGAFTDWDNSARYRNRARIVRGSTPGRFEYWLGRLARKVTEDPSREPFIFLTAWNEWAEAAYLEPDESCRYEYLEAVKRSTV
jgi:hypothetical protein